MLIANQIQKDSSKGKLISSPQSLNRMSNEQIEEVLKILEKF